MPEIDNKEFEVFWLNQGDDKAEVHINKYSTGNVDIQINGVSEQTLNLLAKQLGLEVRKSPRTEDVAVWIEFARARDKSKVTIFQK